MIANLMPPVGLNLFVLQGMGKPYEITFEHVVRGSAPFILIMILAMVLVFVFPSLATWLPATMR